MTEARRQVGKHCGQSAVHVSLFYSRTAIVRANRYRSPDLLLLYYFSSTVLYCTALCTRATILPDLVLRVYSDVPFFRIGYMISAHFF